MTAKIPLNMLVEVLVITKRGKQAEWVPAVLTTANEEKFEVTFEGGSRQRFAPTTDRIRGPGLKAGKLWAF